MNQREDFEQQKHPECNEDEADDDVEDAEVVI